MFRYIAFTWNRSNEMHARAVRQLEGLLNSAQSSGSGAGWRCVLDHPGMKVFCAQQGEPLLNVVPLADQTGVILGTLFRKATSLHEGRQSGASVVDVDATASARISNTEGCDLVLNYWGDYVAFLPTARGSLRVLRGPMSALPAQRYEFDGVHIIFSRLADLLDLQIARLTVNLEYVRGYLLGIAQGHTTGLNEVRELPTGSAWDFSWISEVQEHEIWDPLWIAVEETIEDATEAERALRGAVMGCTHSWASGFDRMLVRLSGGFDSSIVLGCLAESPNHARITCLNAFKPGAGSDERVYARLAAERVGCELVEAAYPDSIRLEPMLDTQPTACIKETLTTLCGRILESETVQQRRIQAAMNGQDGDGLFARTAFQLAVADLIHQHGLRGEAILRAADAARAERTTVWRVLAVALLRSARLGAGAFDEGSKVNNHFLARSLAVPSSRSPSIARWIAAAAKRGVAPGKTFHAWRMCTKVGVFYDSFTGDTAPRQLSPLYSQPVIETALRIPLYLLTDSRGARLDRPLARRAFAAQLPKEIQLRRAKGVVMNHTNMLIRSNIRFIREMLLDGTLMQEGYLNRNHIQDAVSDVPSGIHPGLAQLFTLVTVEAWLRQFSGSRLQAAA